MGDESLKEQGDTAPRIGIFVPTLLGGGAEHVMVTVANGFADRGFTVDMIVGRPDGPNRERLDARINLVDLGAAHVLQCIVPLARYLRSKRPSALLSAMTHTNNAALIAKFLARTNTRMVISERVSISWIPANLKEAFHAWLRPGLYRFADSLVMVAREECHEAARRFHMAPERVTSIYNPVITPEFELARLETAEHPWLSDKSLDDGPVIVAVGRLEHQKDHATLLDAFALLKARRRARLIIFGDGELQETLVRQIDALGLADTVSLAGFVRNPIKEMNAGDLFVLSSRFEGLPGVLIQALGCGLRIVSTDCMTGPREILEGGEWGKLVPVGDAAALADAMERSLEGAPPPGCPTSHLKQFSLSHAVNAYLDRLLPSHESQKTK